MGVGIFFVSQVDAASSLLYGYQRDPDHPQSVESSIRWRYLRKIRSTSRRRDSCRAAANLVTQDFRYSSTLRASALAAYRIKLERMTFTRACGGIFSSMELLFG
jgi:hypothetical protein